MSAGGGRSLLEPVQRLIDVSTSEGPSKGLQLDLEDAPELFEAALLAAQIHDEELRRKREEDPSASRIAVFGEVISTVRRLVLAVTADPEPLRSPEPRRVGTFWPMLPIALMYVLALDPHEFAKSLSAIDRELKLSGRQTSLHRVQLYRAVQALEVCHATGYVQPLVQFPDLIAACEELIEEIRQRVESLELALEGVLLLLLDEEFGVFVREEPPPRSGSRRFEIHTKSPPGAPRHPTRCRRQACRAAGQVAM
jgi:hypothetical protein